MKYPLTFIVLSVLLLSSCATSKSPGTRPSTSVDWKTSVIGTWEGRTSDRTDVMLVTFNADNSAVFDYTPSGGQKFNTNYSFTSDGTIADGIHPENLIVDAEDIDHLRFRPEGKRL